MRQLCPRTVAYLATDSGRARGWSGVLGVLVPAGVILIGIGAFGTWAEVLPSL